MRLAGIEYKECRSCHQLFFEPKVKECLVAIEQIKEEDGRCHVLATMERILLVISSGFRTELGSFGYADGGPTRLRVF